MGADAEFGLDPALRAVAGPDLAGNGPLPKVFAAMSAEPGLALEAAAGFGPDQLPRVTDSTVAVAASSLGSAASALGLVASMPAAAAATGAVAASALSPGPRAAATGPAPVVAGPMQGTAHFALAWKLEAQRSAIVTIYRQAAD